MEINNNVNLAGLDIPTRSAELAYGLCKFNNVYYRDTEDCVYDDYPCDNTRFNLANNRCCAMKINSVWKENEFNTIYNNNINDCLKDKYGYK